MTGLEAEKLHDDIAWELAKNPAQVGRLLAVHHLNESNQECVGCRQWDRPSPLWPCNIYQLAQAASRKIEAVEASGEERQTSFSSRDRPAM